MIDPGTAAIAGSILSGGFGAFGASKQNKAQIALSREQMAFQERMSSTAYQRSMADMKAAGLNPMLAYQKGGASTPAGAQPNIVNELAAPSNSASQLMSNLAAKAQIENIQSQTELNRQQKIINDPKMMIRDAIVEIMENVKGVGEGPLRSVLSKVLEYFQNSAKQSPELPPIGTSAKSSIPEPRETLPHGNLIDKIEKEFPGHAPLVIDVMKATTRKKTETAEQYVDRIIDLVRKQLGR